ncbi:serine/threonine-protein phosphatase 2A activator 1 [Kwoniella heveanensis CBS 569]|nr:serine/threonine-protein phosphatase 2A activator 1 [Kwoniella heveanensis CBS 569]
MQASTSARPPAIPKAPHASEPDAVHQAYLNNLPFTPDVPRQCLTTEEAVSKWQATIGFQRFWCWIRWRSERIKGKDIMRGPYTGNSEGMRLLLDTLDKMSQWVEEVPPQPQSNQRFGNLAFRTYIKLVEERVPELFKSSSMPPNLLSQFLPLLLDSHAFGHPVRIDYGTGHELAFVLAMYVCTIPGWIGGGILEEKQAEEDELVLRVFPRYLDLTTQLQKTYRLEPAGSHGVWGLDDYCFLPYLFGSAQLLTSAQAPSENKDRNEDVLNRDTDKGTDEDTIKDMYTLSLSHLLLFKHGASFSEHSPLLYNLSQIKEWSKIHNGLKRMYLGEVVGKRVVVQGLFVGGWIWGYGLESLPEVTAGKAVYGDGKSAQDQGPREQGEDNNGGGSSDIGTKRPAETEPVGDSSSSGSVGMGGSPITKAPWAK